MAESLQEARQTAGDSHLKNYLLQDVEIKTKSVETALAPLISQVTTLASQPDGSDPLAPTRRRHKAPKLALALQMAVDQFVVVGEKIAHENQDMEGLMMDACQSIRTAGTEMNERAKLFAEDASSSTKRTAMVIASRTLLGAVARLLVLADIADVNKLLRASKRIEEHLKNLKSARTMQELHDSWQIFAPEVVSLMMMVHKRQMDLKDDLMRERIAAARAVFDKSSKMFLTCAGTYLNHKGTSTALENRDYVLGEMHRALKTIAVVVDDDDLSKLNPNEVIVVPTAVEGEVEHNLLCVESFASECLKRAPSVEEKEKAGQKIVIISRAADFLSESGNTREASKRGIVAGCESLRENTQNLLKALDGVGQRGEGLGALQRAVYALEERTRGVRRELRHAMTEHVSDMFIDACLPAGELVEAAEKGDQVLVERKMAAFLQHARSLEKVAALASSLSGNCEGVKLVKYITERMTVLAPQVVNAAETLGGNPSSKLAKKNLAAFKEFWGEMVEGMTDAVDLTVPIQDFMAVSEAHMTEDFHSCLASVRGRDAYRLDQEILLMQGRCNRLLRVLRSNMEENPAPYTAGQEASVLNAVEQLKDKVLPQFCDKGEIVVSALLAAKAPQPVDMSAFHQSTTELLGCVSTLRKQVLLTLSTEELAGDLESLAIINEAQGALKRGNGVARALPPQGDLPTAQERSAATPETPAKESKGASPAEDTSATQHLLARLPLEEQRRLAEASQGLQEQHARFETEAHRWAGQSGTPDNDCVMLAKQMCGMLLDMSDFTRGQGPLKSTDDVIQRAQDIARAADQLDKLARSFTDECPDPSCRGDLLAYLNQMKLCSHQLRITSSVKADLRSSVRETVESANALITSAKNLMAAVVQTVKMCYIASKAIAKVKGHLPDSLLQWEMRTPRKKDLVGASYVGQQMGQDSPRTSERSMNRMDSTIAPLKELGEFRGKGYQSSSV